MTFEQAARDHACSRGAAGTRQLYVRDLDRWLAFCETRGADPTKPTLADASAFKDELLELQKAQTVRRTLSSLSSMYEAAMGFETPFANWNPFKRLPRPSSDLYNRTEVMSGAEAEAILASAAEEESGRDLAILRLLYSTGLRRASVAALERAEVIARDGKTIARVVVKGGKRREVELIPLVAQAVAVWLRHVGDGTTWVFPAKDNRGHIDPSIINKIVSRHGKRAGVVHAHPHRFRASFATTAIDSGIPLHEVQASLHHSSPVTTQRYDRGKRGLGVAEAVAKFRGEK